MLISDFIFYILAFFIVLSSLGVLLQASPLYASLFLVGTMLGVAALFFLLNAPFLAGVQLVVYAGAVMVLFVMVMMLFDLKKESVFWLKDTTRFFKIFFVTWLGSFLFSVSLLSVDLVQKSIKPLPFNSMNDLARLLFTEYILAFEVLGALLLLMAVGVVAVSRIKGGTHES